MHRTIQREWSRQLPLVRLILMLSTAGCGAEEQEPANGTQIDVDEGGDAASVDGADDGSVDDSGDSSTDVSEDSPVDGSAEESVLGSPSTTPVQPPAGSTVRGAGLTDGVLPIRVRAPGLNPDYEEIVPADMVVEVGIQVSGDNATPLDEQDDWGQYVPVVSTTLHGYAFGVLDTNTANNDEMIQDGENLSFSAIFSPQGTELRTSVRLDWSVTYEGIPDDRPYVENCYIASMQAGYGMAIDCFGNDPTGGSLLFNWSVVSDLDDVQMIDFDQTGASITTTDAPTESDIGLHDFAVTCSNGTVTSDPYSFRAPIDEHHSSLMIHCADVDFEWHAFLPETSIDAVALQCTAGFHPANKPDDTTNDAYILDVDDVSCVLPALDTMSAEEREIQRRYYFFQSSASGGSAPLRRTVDGIFSECTVEFAQVVFRR